MRGGDVGHTLQRGTIRSFARRSVYRHRSLRQAVSAVRWLVRGIEPPDLAHLTFAHDTMDGPVQRDEALLLHALIRVLRPKTVVEIGFFRGHSAFNFLRALDQDARLYSFDIDPRCVERAAELFGHDPQVTVRQRSQTEVSAADIDGRLADFVFLDASHDLELNQLTFERLLPLMRADAILAIHDTGTIPRELLAPMEHWALWSPELWVGDECEVMPGERAFVNYLLDEHPDFAQIHLHSRNTLRCGITLLQRGGPLARPGEETHRREPESRSI
jgi:predicted O-methyltransferase YrrM